MRHYQKTPIICDDSLCGTDDSCVNPTGSCTFNERPEGKDLMAECFQQVAVWQGNCIAQRCVSSQAVGCLAWCHDRRTELIVDCTNAKNIWVQTCNFTTPTFPGFTDP